MKGEDISQRLRAFARRVKALVGEFPDDVGGRHIARQLFRSGTSGGANYEEARGAESRKDFAHKCSIAAKELRESAYWLSLIDDDELGGRHNLVALQKEADELIAILTASAKTAKAHRSWARTSTPVHDDDSHSDSH